MSIWCSHESIGFNDYDEPNRGQVRAYAKGFSNHYPTTDGEFEQEAEISLAHAPAWCVPGHEYDSDDDFENVAPWLRLDVFSNDALTWWPKDEVAPTVEPVFGSVVLDEEAARLLVEQLTSWLERPKLHPVELALP